MSVTIREISNRLGLSYQTVADVLSVRGAKRDRYSAKTRELIQQTASELGYRPNQAARAIKTGRFGNIALLMSTDFTHSYLPATLRDAILDALSQHDLHLSLARLDDRALTDPAFVPKILREWTADGLLANYTHQVPQPLEQLVEAHGLPIVWINNKRPTDAVYPDDFGAGKMATEQLLSLGHRRIAYLHLIHGRNELWRLHYNVPDRLAGYEAAMREAGLAPDPRIFPDALPEREWLPWTCQWLASPERPTAVLAYSNVDCVLLAAQRVGLQVPQDLSVASFGDEDCAVAGIPVSFAALDRAILGRQAVEMMVRKIRRNDHEASQIVPFRWVPGATTAAPSS